MAKIQGYNAKLYMTESSGTTTTGEATSNVSGKIYQIDDASKQIIDPSVAVVVKDNGSTVDAVDIQSIDYLFGVVTFDSGYTVTGPVTMDYDYMARVTLADCSSSNLAISFTSLPADVLDGATRGKQIILGQKQATGSLTFRVLEGETIDSSDLTEIAVAGSLLYVEVQPDASNTTTVNVFRSRCHITDFSDSLEPDGLVSASLSWSSAATKSVEGYEVSFSEYTL